MSGENEQAAVENTESTNTTQSCKRKKILKILLGILIAIIALLAVVLWQLDAIATKTTRIVGSAVTGTKVDVKNIAIRPLAGAVKISNFTLANPEGFHNPEAIRVNNLHVDVLVKSVFTDKIEVENLEVSGVAIDFEYKLSGSNLDVILKNVEKNTAAAQSKPTGKEEKKPAEQKAKEAKKTVIRKLVLKDIQLTVSSATLKTKLVIPMLPIEMENVGDGKNLGETISEILTRIISEIVKIVDFNALGKGLSDAGNSIVKGLDGAASSAVSAGDSLGTAAKDAVDTTKKLFQNLPGLGK